MRFICKCMLHFSFFFFFPQKTRMVNPRLQWNDDLHSCSSTPLFVLTAVPHCHYCRSRHLGRFSNFTVCSLKFTYSVRLTQKTSCDFLIGLLIIRVCALSLIMWYELVLFIQHSLTYKSSVCTKVHYNAIFCYKFECTYRKMCCSQRVRRTKLNQDNYKLDFAFLHIFHGNKLSQGSDSWLDYTTTSAVTCGTTQVFFMEDPKRAMIRSWR